MSPSALMNDVCLVCGVTGYPEHLISCSSCKLAKEHRYCMKVLCLSEEAVCPWVCQDCIRFDEDLDNAPISAIFRLKNEFSNVQKDASSTGENADFDDENCVQAHELKESHPQAVEKASFQAEMRLMTNDQESMNEHDLTILQEEVDATLMISGRLRNSNADGKQKRKVVVPDSSDDELTTNVQPELTNSNADSGGSFSLWLDDDTKDAVATNNCDSFLFDAEVVTRESNSCGDVNGVSKLSLGNNNDALLCDNALVNVNENGDEKIVNVNENGDEKVAVGRQASYNACNDACNDASLVKPREGRDGYHNSNGRTNGNDVREKSSLDNDDVALFNSNALVTVSKKVPKKTSLARRALDDACGGACLAKPDRDNSRVTRDNRTNGKDTWEKVSLVGDDFALGNDDGIRCEMKTSLAKRESDDACGGKSLVKPDSDCDNDDGIRCEMKISLAKRESDDACGGKSLVKPDSDCDNGLISHDGTNGNAVRGSFDVSKYHVGVVKDFDRTTNYDGREDDSSPPVDTITWRGYFSLGHSNYGIMHAHLTTTSYNDVHVNEEVKKMNGVLSLEKVPNRIAWPSKFYTSSSPTQKDIHLYFFPKNLGSEYETDYWFDELVRQLHERDISYRAILGCSELLLYPSILLPDYYEKFFGRRYLWGSFRPRQTYYPKPTSRLSEASCNRSNEYPARTGSNSHRLKRNAISVTHDSTRRKKTESGLVPNRRADEDRNSLKLIPATRVSDNYVVDRHVKSGSDSTSWWTIQLQRQICFESNSTPSR